MVEMLRAFTRRLLRDPRRAAGLVAWRVRHDPVWVLLKLAAALDDDRRARWSTGLLRAARWTSARWPGNALAGVVAGFALVQLGRWRDLAAFVDQRDARAGQAERVGLARILVEADRPALALRLLARARVTPGMLEARGRALARQGDLTEAETTLAQAAAMGSPSAEVEHGRTTATLRALSPDWHPATPVLRTVAPGAHASTPTRGRVLHLLNNSLPHTVAGYTVRTHRIAQAQRAVGLDPLMVTRAGYPVLQGVFDAGPSDTVDGITYHRLPAEGLARKGPAALIERNIECLGALLATHRPAVLHPTSPYENARAALALGEAAGLPVVYEVRGFLEQTWRSRHGASAGSSDRYRMTRDIEGWCMRRADRVVTIGEAMRADIIARGADPDHVHVVPNAVDADDFVPRPVDHALRRRLGFADGEVVIGYVSSLVSYEGVTYLLRAIARLRDRGRAVRGLIVGDGLERAGLQHEAVTLGLADVVVFTGRVPITEVQRHYGLIDVFVVPRTNDEVSRTVTPLKPLEAMALERALVVSDVPALRELVEPGETGMVFAAEDAAALADVLEPLVDDPAGRARLGKAAREWVMSERTWYRNGQRYRELYADLGAA
jgi:PEP-CTERM/exosortase A-associated glycosyltransferase